MTGQIEPEKQSLQSMNIIDDQKLKLKQLFPNVFNEDKIDFEKLRQTLGDEVDTKQEHYGLTWAGKSECLKIIQQPSIATLKPCKEESVNFDDTENLFIEGDNLEVLKLLQRHYYGKVKMIYIDPPYNTGNEFIYPDKYSETLDTYLAYTGQVDDEGIKFSTNTEADGRYHSKWLNMMYPRLFLARNLLRDDGVIFISIGQAELGNLTNICNEVYGEENRISICTRLMKTGGQKGKYFSPNTDYVVIYAKSINSIDNFRDELSDDLIKKVYTQIQKDGIKKGERYREMGLFQPSLDIRANQRYYIKCPDGSFVIPPGSTFPNKVNSGEKIKPINGDGVWRWIYDTYHKECEKGNILFKETTSSPLITSDNNKSKWNIYTKIWLNDRLEKGKLPLDMFDKFENRHSAQELNKLEIFFDFAKPSELISYLIGISNTNDSDIVLDFFSGSCTTAHATISINKKDNGNRKFIMVQLPEPCAEDSEAYKAGYKNIAEIGKERIRRVIKNIENEQKQDSAQTTIADESDEKEKQKLDIGFKVFKLDKSNFNIWDGSIEEDTTGDEITKQLQLAIDHIDPDSSEEDILFELLLKSGISLTAKIDEIEVAGKKVYSIDDGDGLLMCLDRELNKEVITGIAKKEPSRVICLDEGFSGNDQLKTNAIQIMKSFGVEDFKTV